MGHVRLSPEIFVSLAIPDKHMIYRRFIAPLVPLSLLLTLAGGCGVPSFLITPVANTNKIEEVTVEGKSGWGAGKAKVAIIGVEGMLANAKGWGFLAPTENPLSLF